MNCSRKSAVSRSLFNDSVAKALASNKLALIASPVHRLDHRQAGRQQGAVVGALFDRVGDDRHAVASCGKEVECELVEEPLHPQQRGNMGFEVDAAGHVAKLVHTLAGEVVTGVSRPGA